MSDMHHQNDRRAVPCGVLTISDTRSEKTDTSGQLIRRLLADSGHEVITSNIIPDEPHQIKMFLQRLAETGTCHAVLLTGGTGMAARDVTYEVVSELVNKQIVGFGELFRRLSYEQIGAQAILSRAVAGTYKRMVLYAMPGSTAAAELAVEQIVLPTLAHTVALVRND